MVLTEPFRDVVTTMLAYQQTDRPLPAVILPHPMQNISQQEIGERALLLADAAERLLRGEDPQ